MFKFYGLLDRRSFLWGSIVRLTLFVASVAAFPYFLRALATITECQRVPGACGLVGLIGSTAFKPLAFAIFTFSFVGISMRRARDVGVPAWVGLLVPLLFLADRAFLVHFGAPWSLAFSSGVLSTVFPRYACLALLCIGALCVLPSQNSDRQLNPFGTTGWILFALGTFIALTAAITALLNFPAASHMAKAIAGYWWIISKLVPYAMFGLSTGLVWIALRAQGPANTEPTTAISEPESRPASNIPIQIILLTSAALAIAAVLLVAPRELSSPLVILVQFTAIVLPTLLLYFCLLLAGFLFVRSRTPVTTAFFILALLPFLHWAYSHWSAAQAHKNEVAEIAAIPTKRAPRIPPTMVIESSSVAGSRAIWKVPEIEHLIYKGAHGNRLIQVNRPAGSGLIEQKAATALPDEYLLLKVGDASAFAKKRQIYGPAGGPFELRFVDPQRDDLVAVWYSAFNPHPSFLPVLTEQGWFRGPNTTTEDMLLERTRQFIEQGLRGAGS